MWACFSNHNCWFCLCSSLSTHSSTAFWLLGLAQMHILENRVQSSLSPHASHPHMPSPPLWLQNLAHAPILLAVITNSGPHSVSWGSCHAVLSELLLTSFCWLPPKFILYTHLSSFGAGFLLTKLSVPYMSLFHHFRFFNWTLKLLWTLTSSSPFHPVSRALTYPRFTGVPFGICCPLSSLSCLSSHPYAYLCVWKVLTIHLPLLQCPSRSMKSF